VASDWQIAAATVAGVIVLLLSRATGGGWPASVGLGALFGAGAFLWAIDRAKSWGGLGQGILLGVGVALALLWVQRDADNHIRAVSEQRDDQLREADARRQRADDRRALQLTLTLQHDLRNVALAGEDLRGFHLAGKRFSQANLSNARFDDADLVGADLSGVVASGTNFDRARLKSADLRNGIFGPVQSIRTQVIIGQNPVPASFKWADLEGAKLREAQLAEVDLLRADLNTGDLRGAILSGANLQFAFLAAADLRRADLSGADLRQAKLGGGATLCDANLAEANLAGAEYDDTTRWPRGFDPAAHGAHESVTAALQSLPGGIVQGVQSPYHPPC
jgi:uncharacterized protein YjbI with pentapeptide repeats